MMEVIMKSKWEESKMLVYDMLNCAEKKTEKFLEVQKARYNLSKLNDELKSLYIELGKNAYRSSRQSEVITDNDKIISKIDVTLKKIKSAEKTLDDLLNAKICRNCGYKNKSDAKFCSGCSSEIN